jgi:CBS domain-containing protein
MEPNVEDVMTRRLRTVTTEYTLADVRDIFEKEHFRHLPVLDGNTLVGIISRTDLMRITYGVALANDTADGDDVNELLLTATSVGEAMTADVRTIEPGSPLSEAARLMVHDQISALPVVGDEGLLGMLTTTDILNRYIHLHH